jgi:cyclase
MGRPERIIGNLHCAYAELNGTPLDLIATFADIVDHNGGRLIICYA